MAEPPASLPLTYPGAVVKQDAEPVKKDAAAGPIASSLSTLTSIPPLSDIGEPGDTQVGLGAWLSSHSGHVTKTGEYQGVSPSPFWVVDGLYSNGFRTLGIYGNQTDNESNQAGLHYFQPGLFADVEYQRFIHRLEHVPLTNFTPSNAITDKTNFPANSTVLGRDRNVGEDYAIRVEELQSSTGWKVNDNLRVRVDFWQMRKFGDRQENAAAHCFVAAKGASRADVQFAFDIQPVTLGASSRIELASVRGFNIVDLRDYSVALVVAGAPAKLSLEVNEADDGITLHPLAAPLPSGAWTHVVLSLGLTVGTGTSGDPSSLSIQIGAAAAEAFTMRRHLPLGPFFTIGVSATAPCDPMTVLYDGVTYDSK